MLFRSLAVALFLSLCTAGTAIAEVRIALLPIAVYAAGGDSEYLQTGLAEMIAARLDQYEGVTVVRPRVEGAPPTAAESARAAAEGVDAQYVLYGSFTRFGNGASLDLRCAEVATPAEGDSDQTRRLFIQSGELAEIIPRLDTLSQKVARYALANSKPRVVGADDGKQPPAPPGPTQSEYQALVKRVEELERTRPAAVAGSAEDDSASVR